MGGVRLELAVQEVAGDDAAGPPIDGHQVKHFPTGEHLHPSQRDLAHEDAVGAEEELLAGLAAAVERPRHLSSPEGAVGQRAAVLAGEGNALRDALIDNVRADRGEAIDVGFAGAEVAPFTVS